MRNGNNLHFHGGTTCHGAPTLQEVVDEAVKNWQAGKVLEQVDVRDGVEVKCYSLIVDKFKHWAKHGRFVAEVEPEWKVVLLTPDSVPRLTDDMIGTKREVERLENALRWIGLNCTDLESVRDNISRALRGKSVP